MADRHGRAAGFLLLLSSGSWLSHRQSTQYLPRTKKKKDINSPAQAAAIMEKKTKNLGSSSPASTRSSKLVSVHCHGHAYDATERQPETETHTDVPHVQWSRRSDLSTAGSLLSSRLRRMCACVSAVRLVSPDSWSGLARGSTIEVATMKPVSESTTEYASKESTDFTVYGAKGQARGLRGKRTRTDTFHRIASPHLASLRHSTASMRDSDFLLDEFVAAVGAAVHIGPCTRNNNHKRKRERRTNQSVMMPDAGVGAGFLVLVLVLQPGLGPHDAPARRNLGSIRLFPLPLTPQWLTPACSICSICLPPRIRTGTYLGVPCAMHIHNLVSLVHPILSALALCLLGCLAHTRRPLTNEYVLYRWIHTYLALHLLALFLYGALGCIHTPLSSSRIHCPHPKNQTTKTQEYTRNAIQLPNKTIVTPPSPCTFALILRPYSSSTVCRLFDRGFNFATSAKSKVVPNALLNGSSVSGFNVSSLAIRHPRLVSLAPHTYFSDPSSTPHSPSSSLKSTRLYRPHSHTLNFNADPHSPFPRPTLPQVSASKPSVSGKTFGLGLASTAHLLRFLTCWLEPFEWVDIRPLLLVYKAFGFACHSSFLTY
ncbi:uncharacterized protein CLUP02_07648 [Colletotrichum lupini]|uniref:Uncharacterized protein n=1 Tax=Colletotrichum lupini TaxID=145971 RepID=A0A9Q8WGQ0_9PEZI|nr:uncharacterized protein CLUP02_07648 [Colletotrichum lupini]UQC82162.1 hypothetical protein CLUP02_07648 [Colletotrichum lupini]